MNLYEIPLVVDSSPSQGALNITSDGSSFEINLDTPITIPKDAKQCYLQTTQATVWWVIPNIVTGVNDKFNIDDGVNPAYDITIPQGLYDVENLENAIKTGISNLGGDENIINLVADSSTQKVIIRLNLIGAIVDFTVANSCRVIMGFNSAVIGPSTVDPQDFIAPNQAAFNTVEYFLIHSDLTPHGIRTNNNETGVISQVLINVSPGSQIVHQPFNPVRIPCNNLIGSKIKRARFWITDQSNNLINTNNETWSAGLSIKYTY